MADYPDTGLPSDGRGGFLWNDNITFPTYANNGHPHGSSANITWANLDGKFMHNEQVDATAGVCFGLCLLTFLNIVALTAKSKRGLPVYTFTLIALGLLAARYLTLMVLYTDLEAGSAYYSIAEDYADGETIQSIIGIVFVIWLPPFALLFVVLCFYVQGKCALVLIAMKHRYFYKGIMSYLIILSICSVALRMIYAAFVTVYQFNLYFFLPDWMNTAVLATYTATILSWSLVFSWQVGICIFKRYKIGVPIEKSEGMAILFMTGIESMLIPMIFTIFQLCHLNWFPQAEYLIMPSVACIIPFGSIWAGAANQHASLQRAMHTTATRIVCNNCSEMLSNRPPTPNDNHSGNITGIGNSCPPSRPINQLIFLNHTTKDEGSDSAISEATTMKTTTNPRTRANMPVTSNILGTAGTALYAEDIHTGALVTPTTPAAPNGPRAPTEAVHYI